MAVFFAMVDIAALNAFVIWSKLQRSESMPRHGDRKQFLRSLGRSLCVAAAQKRQVNSLPTSIRTATARLLDEQAQPDASNAVEACNDTSRGRCYKCLEAIAGPGYKGKRKKLNCHIQSRCCVCHRRVCTKHAVEVFRCNTCDGPGVCNNDINYSK